MIFFSNILIIKTGNSEKYPTDLFLENPGKREATVKPVRRHFQIARCAYSVNKTTQSKTKKGSSSTSSISNKQLDDKFGAIQTFLRLPVVSESLMLAF